MNKEDEAILCVLFHAWQSSLSTTAEQFAAPETRRVSAFQGILSHQRPVQVSFGVRPASRPVRRRKGAMHEESKSSLFGDLQAVATHSIWRGFPRGLLR